MNGRNQAQTIVGLETVEKIAKKLKKYGEVDIETYGNWGNPDLVFDSYIQLNKVEYPLKFGVECKRASAKKFSRGVNTVSITRQEWEGLKDWCSGNEAYPMLIVEFHFSKRKNIYFVIERDRVQHKYEKGDGKDWFVFSLWQILEYGTKLDDYFCILQRR